MTGIRRITLAKKALFVAVIVSITLPATRALANDLIEVFTEPFQVIDLAASEAGILESLEAKQGDIVHAGDIVAYLNRDILVAQMAIAKLKAAAKAQTRRATADVNQKRRRHAKLAALHAKGHASEEEIDSAQSQLEIAAAGHLEVEENLRLAQLEVKRIEAQLRRREIRSPITGQIVRFEKDPGEYVTSIEPMVAQIVQLDKLRVKFYIDTTRARTIQAGDRIPLFLIDTQQRTEGIVEFVSPTTDADSRTVRVEVMIDNQKDEFRSGVSVRIEDFRQARRR